MTRTRGAAAAVRRAPLASLGALLASAVLAVGVFHFGFRPSSTGNDPVSADGQPTTSATVPIPTPPPFVIAPITAATAFEINAGIPVSDRSNPPARSMTLAGRTSEDRQRALFCLTNAIYYESASEPDSGQRAVAQVVLNRVRHPAFPSTVCGVVYQGSERSTGCQFTFTCDGSLRRNPSAAGWRRARATASAALAGGTFPQVGLATHYHTHWVVPYWAKTLSKTTIVGAHIFYRWKGWWGEPGAFRSSARGAEPDIATIAPPSESEPPSDGETEPLILGAQDAALLPAMERRPAADENDSAPLADRQAGALILNSQGVESEPPAAGRSDGRVQADKTCSRKTSVSRPNGPAKPIQPISNKLC